MLASVVAEVDAAEAVVEGAEQAAGVDLGKLFGVADEHDLDPALALAASRSGARVRVPAMPASSTIRTVRGWKAVVGESVVRAAMVVEGMPAVRSSWRAALAATAQPTTSVAGVVSRRRGGGEGGGLARAGGRDDDVDAALRSW